MKKVGIVILNYLNYKDTIECIESIQKDKYKNKDIIIVDNGSNNNSLEEIKKFIENKKRIYILESKKNLGYSQGNNIGIKYAREKLNSEFILIINNDTLFIEKDMISKLINSYEPGIALIGPRIINKLNQNQNPLPITVSKEMILYHKKKYFIWYLKSLDICIFLKKLLLRNDNKEEVSLEEKIQESNVCTGSLILHGACLLITPDYFSYYPIIFPKTFLYYEEVIFSILTQKVGLKNKFVVNCKIYHKEDGSSNMSFNNKNKMKFKHTYKSVCYAKKLINLNYHEIIKKFFDDN